MSVSPQLAASWHIGSQSRRIGWLTILASLASIVFAGLIPRLEFVAIVPILVWATVIAIIWRPFIGLCVTIGLMCLFEVGGVDVFMEPGEYIHYGLQHTLGLSGLIVSPLEMLLLFSMLIWLVQGIAGDGLRFRGGQLGKVMLLFTLALLGGMIRGRIGGGDSYIGFWELRPLLYILACYVLAANLVRTRRHVRMVMASILIGTSLFAVEGAYRRVVLIDNGFITANMEAWYGHDTVIFLASLVVLIIAQQVVGAVWWQRLLGLMVLPLAIFTMLATERRAGQVAMIVAVLALFTVFLFAYRKAFLLIAVPVLIGGAIYLPLFWNASGVLAQPARAIRSISDPDPRDAASNLSRELEKINVRATIREFPLQGVGFGMPFLQVVSIPNISFFPFWNYEPHHNLFWIWLKTGVVGYVLFWTLIGTTLARAAYLSKTLAAPDLRIFALLAIGGIVSTLTFCYVDLGLTLGRTTVFLGALIGMISVLDQIPAE
jgi:hypothetical protein